MFDFENEVKRGVAAGNKPLDGFTGAVRNLDATVLAKGMTIKFPDSYEGKIFSQLFGENEVPYVLTEAVDADGVESVCRFYPSTFTKQRTVYENTAKGQPLRPVNPAVRVRTQGTAAEHYRTFATVAEAMESFKGRKVKVTKMDTYKTKAYDREELQDCHIATIDFVD